MQLLEKPSSVSVSAPHSPWRTFATGLWNDRVNVRDFIQRNYRPYEGEGSFLNGSTKRTVELWGQIRELLARERRAAGGMLDLDTAVISGICSHPPGYIDRNLEVVVGLQTDAPLKRAFMPFGGYRMAAAAVESAGRTVDPATTAIFKHRKTHNEGVFDAYTPEIRLCRSVGIITGLPDAYGRGRIIGDYRRVALYGIDRLVADKKEQLAQATAAGLTAELIRDREELSEQIRALGELRTMAADYGCNVSRPATNATEAVQWTYLAYLAAVKEQNGAAMSIGRIATFLDIYIERDLAEGVLTESAAQELIDQLVLKLRLVRFARTPEYNELFSGDPTWVTESLGGMGVDGRTLVTKSCFRFLQTLHNLGAAPEPNLTVLWAERLPQGFKEFCARTSIETSSLQYENDDLMRGYWGDDYAIACCVSAMRVGKQMQFFGARANLGKTLLYAINGGVDELQKVQVAPPMTPILGDVLDFDEVKPAFERMMGWLASQYVGALNIIHYMHDKYCYERIQMALHDREILRTLACGIAGLSVAADALSAMKYAKVHVIRDDSGLAVDYRIEGYFPKFGNDDERVDSLARWCVETFMAKLRQQPAYRDSVVTQSVLTITSNVVYGKKTGHTPDGRRAGEPFAPGANPMHGRDSCGAIASMASVASLPYQDSQDGISYTFSIVPGALGRDALDQVNNLSGLLDGYFASGGHHINVNVFDRATLEAAMAHPEKYPQLTVRVSGYAVNFVKLSREQQLDVINRTFHGAK
ncbi:MAG: pflB [Rariglobus sp.]|jgi:formate C-acetyltransferase|nr:pflB [Rariglobus sp.]